MSAPIAWAASTAPPVAIAPDRSKRAVEPGADFLDEREGRERSRMAAGAGRNRDQPVGALADGGIGMAVVDDVMQHDAAIGMDRRIDLRHGAERGDDDRHLVFDAEHQVVFEPLVGLVDDLVDGEGCRRPVRDCAALWAASSSVISASHSSSCASGRALSAGNEPTTPALHCASTSAGCEMMNSGAATTGSRGGAVENGWQGQGFAPGFDYLTFS